MSVTFAQGFSAAGVEAGISAVEGKKDLALVVWNRLAMVGYRIFVIELIIAGSSTDIMIASRRY